MHFPKLTESLIHTPCIYLCFFFWIQNQCMPVKIFNHSQILTTIIKWLCQSLLENHCFLSYSCTSVLSFICLLSFIISFYVFCKAVSSLKYWSHTLMKHFVVMRMLIFIAIKIFPPTGEVKSGNWNVVIMYILSTYVK